MPLAHRVQPQTARDMIMIGGRRVEALSAGATGRCLLIAICCRSRLDPTVLPHIMNHQIRLRESALIGAASARTFERTVLILLVLGLDMKIQRRLMKEPLLAMMALKRKFSLVLLHVIMHRALESLCLTAVRADKVAVGILGVLEMVRRHSGHLVAEGDVGSIFSEDPRRVRGYV